MTKRVTSIRYAQGELMKDMKAVKDQILTLDELSEYLKVSKSSLYKLVQRGQVPGQKVGKHWRFRRQTIDHWLDDKTKQESQK